MAFTELEIGISTNSGLPQLKVSQFSDNLMDGNEVNITVQRYTFLELVKFWFVDLLNRHKNSIVFSFEGSSVTGRWKFCRSNSSLD